MKKIIFFPVFIGMMIIISFFSEGCTNDRQPSVLRVAIPYSDKVQDADTNYYIKWLEEKTGLDLEITLIRQTRSSDYLNTLFSSGTDIDVVMFGADFTVSDEELQKYIASGDILTENGTNVYLNYGATAGNRAGQILWINYEWLRKLGLSVPSTTDDLEKVLLAFKENDPNGNGINDEIPLAGTTQEYAFAPYELIMDSFVYNDPYHSRFGINDNIDVQTAVTDEFRKGLIFCHRLYENGLIDKDIFNGNLNRLRELVNSPDDLVGAFSSDSVSDVIYQGNPEIMARFIHVAPLTGPEGVKNALLREYKPSCGAVINAHSKNITAAKQLLDTMMTEEASLIARYGERGVDWDFSEGSDVSIYGGASTIVTFNYIWNTSQNKHLNGIGPMKVPEVYLEGVTWNGINSDTEYIDGRAQISYRAFLPKVEKTHETDKKLSEYLDAAVKEFIEGKRDVENDEEWEKYVDGYRQ